MCELSDSDCLQVLSIFALGRTIGPPFRFDPARAEQEIVASFEDLKQCAALGWPVDTPLESLADWWKQWRGELGKLHDEARRKLEQALMDRLQRARRQAIHLERFAREFLIWLDKQEGEMQAYFNDLRMPIARSRLDVSRSAMVLSTWLLAIKPDPRDVLELMYLGPYHKQVVTIALSKGSPLLARVASRREDAEVAIGARAALEVLLCLAKHRAHFTVARKAFAGTVRYHWKSDERQQQELDRVWNERSLIEGMLDAVARAELAQAEAAKLVAATQSPGKMGALESQFNTAWEYLLGDQRLTVGIYDNCRDDSVGPIVQDPEARPESSLEQDSELHVEPPAPPPIEDRLIPFCDGVYGFFYGTESLRRGLKRNSYRAVDALLAELFAEFKTIPLVNQPAFYATELTELLTTFRKDAEACLPGGRLAPLVTRLHGMSDDLCHYFQNYDQHYRSTSPLQIAGLPAHDPEVQFVAILTQLKNHPAAVGVAAIDALTSLLDRPGHLSRVRLALWLACDESGVWQQGEQNDHNLGRYFCVRADNLRQIRSRRCDLERELLKAKRDFWLGRLEDTVAKAGQRATKLSTFLEESRQPILGFRVTLPAPAQQGERLAKELRELAPAEDGPEAIDPQGTLDANKVANGAYELRKSLAQLNVAIESANSLCQRAEALRIDDSSLARGLSHALCDLRAEARKSFHNTWAYAEGFLVDRQRKGLAEILPRIFNWRRPARDSWGEGLTDVLERLDATGPAQ